jgi:hypothetical protein
VSPGPGRRRRGRLRRFWRAVRTRLSFAGRGGEPPAPDWPDDDPALVPTGPPRGPRPAAAAALGLPTEPDPAAYPTETDAVGDALEDEDEDEDDGEAPQRPV